MPFADYTPDEINAIGEVIYEERIRHLVEETENGKIVVVDVKSGDWEMDWDDWTASQRLRERQPKALTFAVKVGYGATVKFGLGRVFPVSES